MICKTCKKMVEDGLTICPYCNSAIYLDSEKEPENQKDFNSSNNGLQLNEIEGKVKNIKMLGIISIISSAFSLFCCLGWIGGIIAIVVLVLYNSIEPNLHLLSPEGKNSAQTGKKLAIIALIIASAFFIIAFIKGSIGLGEFENDISKWADSMSGH